MSWKKWVAGITFGLVGTFLALLAWGIAIRKTCVPGNPDYEKGSGFCIGNGRESELRRVAQRAAAEKERAAAEKERAAAEKERKAREAKALAAKRKEEADLARRKEHEKMFHEMTYICEASIKSSLRDPKSYERIESTYYATPGGEGKKGVIINYRARNGFGGMNVVSTACLTESGKIEDLRVTGTTDGQ